MRKDINTNADLVLSALSGSEAFQLYKKQLEVPINDSNKLYKKVLGDFNEQLSNECIGLKVSGTYLYSTKYDLKYSKKYMYLTDVEVNKVIDYFEKRGFIVYVKKCIKLIPFKPRHIKFTINFDFSKCKY